MLCVQSMETGAGLILGISSVLMFPRKEIDFARLEKQPWPSVLWEE